MEQIIVYDDLYRFSSYLEPIDLAFNQYLLLADAPLLVHTGNTQQAKELVVRLKDILKDRPLTYIFVSHFESDECGGLKEVLAAYPEAKVLCSEVTARQITGFDLTDRVQVQAGGETLDLGKALLRFLSYPSEMHLWEGLLLYEEERGIFFSSDLVFRTGPAAFPSIESRWSQEVEGVTREQIPDDDKRATLQDALLRLDVRFVATGHGPCVQTHPPAIPQTLKDVLGKESIVAIASQGASGPHLINTWNSYVTLTDRGLFIMPAGRMGVTGENLLRDPRVLMTLGSREVQGLQYLGTGFSLRGLAYMEEEGPLFEQVKERFPWARAALVVRPEVITQTL